jgi:hypothetical protein
MTIRVIDLFEMIEIEHQTTEWSIHPLCSGKLNPAQFKEAATVL